MVYRIKPENIYIEKPIFYVVSKTYLNFPYFEEEIFCELFVEELRSLRIIKNFKIYAFSIIYDHVNLMVEPHKRHNISQTMHSLKRNNSRNANKIMGYNTFAPPPVGEFAQTRLQVDNKVRIWKKEFMKKYPKPYLHFPMFKWQKTFYDHIIRNERDFEHHYNYTVYNHLKHGLPKDWKYTSLNFPHLLDKMNMWIKRITSTEGEE